MYSIWVAMRRRCNNPKDKNYKHYGGRGIVVCPRWEDFANFRRDMGEPDRGLKLERIDNDKGYRPDNCRWATAKEQANNSRQNFRIDYLGKTWTLQQLAEAAGMNRYTLRSRILRGLTPAEAIHLPLRPWGINAPNRRTSQ